MDEYKGIEYGYAAHFCYECMGDAEYCDCWSKCSYCSQPDIYCDCWSPPVSASKQVQELTKEQIREDVKKILESLD